MAKENKPQSKKNIKKYILMGLGVLILVGAVIIGYQVYLSKLPPDKKVIAKVGKEKIYEKDLIDTVYSIYGREDLNNFVPEEASKTRKEIVNRLIEKKILKQAATKMGVNVGEEEIIKKAQESFDTILDNKPERKKFFLKSEAEYFLIKELILNKVLTWREGKAILINASLHFFQAPTELSAEERQKLVSEDLKYAENLINSLYNKIKSGEITFDRGMDIINNDPRLGINAWKPWLVNFGFSFNKEQFIARELFPASAVDIWKEISRVPIGEISGPMRIKMVLDEDCIVGKRGDIVDAFFLIIKAEKGNDGEVFSYEEWLENQKKEIGVNIYNF